MQKKRSTEPASSFEELGCGEVVAGMVDVKRTVKRAGPPAIYA